MRKDIAKSLLERAKECARVFSDKNRVRNYGGETSEVDDILPLSETTACVVFKKSSEKKSCCFFYLRGDGQWVYFFPSDSHILGMSLFSKHKEQIEGYNFTKNFY